MKFSAYCATTGKPGNNDGGQGDLVSSGHSRLSPIPNPQSLSHELENNIRIDESKYNLASQMLYPS